VLSDAGLTLLALSAGLAACRGPETDPADPGPPALVTPMMAQSAIVGVAFSIDATSDGALFSGRNLVYGVALSPPTRGLTTANGQIAGVPTSTGVVRATVTATDDVGRAGLHTFPIAVFAAGLKTPVLPATPFLYTDAASPLPPHFVNGGPGGAVVATDNTPPHNPTTDQGAALGRVMFYDTRLSANDKTACASCHIQARGFADTAIKSAGFLGGRTGRHSPGLANARFYQRGRFFWDERAATLEAQALMPIQDPVEMGLSLADLEAKLSATAFYAPLFAAAFGSPDVTADRVSRAIAQFVRSLKSTQSRFDASFGPNGTPLPPLEPQGQQLFNGPAGCSPCHANNAQVSDNVHNTGLDSVITDVGAGNGRFKSPSLRNVGARGPYMHDGRFATLQQVVAFYDTGVNANPGLDGRLRNPGDTTVKRLSLTPAQRSALVAFLHTLTDSTFLKAPRFANPFPP